jgi:hypothetical protein
MAFSSYGGGGGETFITLYTAEIPYTQVPVLKLVPPVNDISGLGYRTPRGGMGGGGGHDTNYI